MKEERLVSNTAVIDPHAHSIYIGNNDEVIVDHYKTGFKSSPIPGDSYSMPVYIVIVNIIVDSPHTPRAILFVPRTPEDFKNLKTI